MVDLAKRRVGDSAEVITCDLAKTPLPLKSAFFQLIVCSLTIHYIQDLNALFREFHRLLRTSGQLVFSTHHPMVDYNSHPEGNYHSIELVEETWDTVGRPVKVRFYRRPISQLFMPLISAGFSIEVVDEGKPTQECKEKYPKAFAKLSSKPGFIFVRARKK
jgi:SAM-dependent methyltransferase